MGKLHYGDAPAVIEFDDRALAHVQLVINAKLRRHEGFFFSWVESIQHGSGHGSVWMHTEIPLRIEFSTAQRHAINLAWLEELTRSANSAAGLRLTAEPVDPAEPSSA